MNSTNEAPNIIDAIMTMDSNDEVAVANVMDKIVNLPFIMSFLLGSLAATPKHHRQTELIKKRYCYYAAWTPHDLFSIIFGIDKGPHFLFNIFEPQPYPRHEIPFENYGHVVEEQDDPVPQKQNLNIDNLVRIDVFGNRQYKIRNMNVPENSAAHGRHVSIGNVDVDEAIVSLHRRVEGYKITQDATNSELSAEGYWDQYVDPNDTFENEILNEFYTAQKKIEHPGEMLEFAKGLLSGVKIWQPYRESGNLILAVESPIDGTLFMLTFDRTVGKFVDQQKRNSKVVMRKLLAHYIPEYVTNPRHTSLMAIAFDVDDMFDECNGTITSLMHSTESNEVKKTIKIYKNKVSLMHRCRAVILRNISMLGDMVSDYPEIIQEFIYSNKSPLELIDF